MSVVNGMILSGHIKGNVKSTRSRDKQFPTLDPHTAKIVSRCLENHKKEQGEADTPNLKVTSTDEFDKLVYDNPEEVGIPGITRLEVVHGRISE
jgi:hypothetical protein